MLGPACRSYCRGGPGLCVQEQLGALRDQLAGVEAQAHSLSQQVATQGQELAAKQAGMEQVRGRAGMDHTSHTSITCSPHMGR